MPRAQSRTSSRPTPVPSKPPLRGHDPYLDVLDLSSPILESSPLPPRAPKRATATSLAPKRKKPKAPITTQDVIEISSDDDDVAPTQDRIIADLRKQVKRLKEDNSKYHDSCFVLRSELNQARENVKAVQKAAETQRTEGKYVLDMNELDDDLNCEICSGRLYTPFMLPDCGHTFCMSCLRDWFGTAHARFMQTQPHWNNGVRNANIARIQGLLHPSTWDHPHIAHHLRQLQPPTPEYTCPTCRKRIYRRPVEAFALKSLVRKIVSTDEKEKQEIPHDEPLVERRHGHLVVADPWGGFFPT